MEAEAHDRWSTAMTSAAGKIKKGQRNLTGIGIYFSAYIWQQPAKIKALRVEENREKVHLRISSYYLAFPIIVGLKSGEQVGWHPTRTPKISFNLGPRSLMGRKGNSSSL